MDNVFGLVNAVLLLAVASVLGYFGNERFKLLNQRIDRLETRMDRFEERVERRFEQVDQRFDRIDQRFERMAAAIAEVRSDITRLAISLVPRPEQAS
jgi:hypothetical protein